jgi:hypothetical protein
MLLGNKSMLIKMKILVAALVVVGVIAKVEVRLSVACRCLSAFVRFVLFDGVDVVVSRSPLSRKRICEFEFLALSASFMQWSIVAFRRYRTVPVSQGSYDPPSIQIIREPDFSRSTSTILRLSVSRPSIHPSTSKSAHTGSKLLY